jgi:hypothetical protein
MYETARRALIGKQQYIRATMREARENAMPAIVNIA